jgi:anti-sigma-K factor RskA
MNFHSKNRTSWPTAEENPYHNDEVDALVRWALRDSVAGEEPSPEVWHRIKARLEQPKTQFHHRRKRLLSAQLSWLVQLLVLGIIVLVVFGLSLSEWFDLSLDHKYVVNGTLTPQPDSEKVVSFSTDDHMLSGYQLFQLARELTIFDRRLAP